MLTITIRNDGTGTDEAANYTYLVTSNEHIAHGLIEGHNRADGWRVLALEMVAPGMFEALQDLTGDIASFLEDADLHRDIWNLINVGCGYHYEQARAAIAAVKGET